MALRRIIDKRRKEKYMVDDEYLNGMARLCGWHGTIVYNSLCRHTNKDQTCFPSIRRMAEQHNVDRKTILKGIDLLVARNVISVSKIYPKKSNSGRLNNEYTLIDKSEWIYDKVPEKDLVSKSTRRTKDGSQQGLRVVRDEDTKETHNKGNKYKETHTTQSKKTKNKENLSRVVNHTAEDIRLVDLLVSLIQQNNPEWHMKGKRDVWAEHISKLHKIDGRTYEQIEAMIIWIQQDPFWSQNILSTAKLRDKFNDLIPRIKGSHKKGGTNKQIFI